MDKKSFSNNLFDVKGNLYPSLELQDKFIEKLCKEKEHLILDIYETKASWGKTLAFLNKEILFALDNYDFSDNIKDEITLEFKALNLQKLFDIFSNLSKENKDLNIILSAIKVLNLEYTEALSFLDKDEIIDKNKQDDVAFFSQILKNIGDYDSLLIFYEDILKSLKKKNLFISSETAEALNSLSKLYFFLADYKKSISYSKQSFSINNKTDANIFLLSRDLNNIALSYFFLKEYDEALFYFEKIVKINNKSNINFGTYLSNMAELFIAQKDYDLAFGLLQQAIRHDSILYKKRSNPILAKRLSRIAYIFFRQKKYEKSLKLHQRAHRIDMCFYTSSDTKIAIRLFNIGVVLIKLERYEEAISCYEEAELILLKKLGSEHKFTKFIEKSTEIAKNLNQK